MEEETDKKRREGLSVRKYQEKEIKRVKKVRFRKRDDSGRSLESTNAKTCCNVVRAFTEVCSSQFLQHFTQSFCVCRSQKCKKD